MKTIIVLAFLLLSFSGYSQVPNTLSPAEKVYGLSKFWQEVNYNFVYLNRVDRTQWDNRYKELITIVQNTKNDYEYYRELQKFCAFLKDGHTNVYLPKTIEQMNTMFGDYRFFIENIGDKAIITRVNFSKKDEIPVGSEVIEVNGMPTQKYIDEKVAPYISSSTNYVVKDYSMSGLLRGLEGDTFTLKIQLPDNKIKTLTLTHKTTREKEVYPAFEPDRQLLDFKWVNKDIAYVSLNSFEDNKIDSLFIGLLPELYKAKGLIIDLRYNGGGSTGIGTAILKYLSNDTVFYGARNTTREHNATYKAWGTFFTEKDTLKDNPDWGMTKQEVAKFYLMAKGNYYYNFPYETETIHLNAKRIVVPTVLLIGHNTASAAEDFLIRADNQKHMIKIGQNSFGSTGQPLMFDLPGGGSARVCTKKDTYPDGREFVGFGVKPDIEVIPTLNDYLHKKDPAMDNAVSYLKKKLVK